MYTSSYVEEFGPTKLYATRVLARQSVTCGAPESIVIGSPFVTRVGTPERDGPDIVIIILRGQAWWGCTTLGGGGGGQTYSGSGKREAHAGSATRSSGAVPCHPQAL